MNPLKGWAHRLLSSGRIRSRDLWLTLVPALIWWGVLHSRPWLLGIHCVSDPGICSAERLTSIDQLSVHLEDRTADDYSFRTQKAAAWVFGGPVALHAGLWLLGRATPQLAMVNALEDLIVLGQTTLWNGALLEVARVVVQRPRPFVYKDPQGLGSNPAHYTSFYSGHTSFVAAITLGFFLVLVFRKVDRRWWVTAAAFSLSMTFLTGLFRVLAGRHFPTDVIVAALAGYAVAFSVAWLHRDCKSDPGEMRDQ